MNDPLLLAFGHKGLALQPPPGVQVAVPRPVRDVPYTPPAEMIRAALHAQAGGPALRDLAAGRRRVAIYVGDETWPAPNEAVLPTLVKELVDAGIRPTRIGFFSCPSACGPALGRDAIRRYGEAIVGDHELAPCFNRAAPGPDERAALADLRLAVLPSVAGAKALLPGGLEIHGCLLADPGDAFDVRAAGVRWGGPDLASALDAVPAPAEAVAGVYLTTGGGARSDATLEDALAGLRRLPPLAPDASIVLAFDGEDGLGSARFTLDLFDLLKLTEAGEVPGDLPQDRPWDAGWALYDLLRAKRRIVLLSPGLAESAEGDELRDELAASPTLFGRVVLAAQESELWPRLAEWHGERYALFAEPLGWRAGRLPLNP
ncbi:MAG: DUF2088 domain-containing protein [Planctomycetota bacterium]|nr:DUF2088 domain-containing protein [Planctomycetota bacterium]